MKSKIIFLILLSFLLTGCSAESRYEKKMTRITDDFFEIVYEKQTINVFEDTPEEEARIDKMMALMSEIDEITPPEKYTRQHNQTRVMVVCMIQYTSEFNYILDSGDKTNEDEMKENELAYEMFKEDLEPFFEEIKQ
jgi:hypothetical protein